ncbi:MAG TPA: NAD(P)/FAD-dependent oxidoreductase [Pyrinomonadaceae bacterium]|nr:NAD(P)/FAD-dependent oxidoreductase [Pyrinomonadaceae bacterium]
MWDVIIIGGGAAGLFCAIESGKRKRKTLVLEHNSRVGRKIEISGGGRCNFTNIHTTPDAFLSQNPHFAKSALARYSAEDFISLVKKHRIRFHEKKLGQLFCDSSSQGIIDMLLTECSATGVVIKSGCHVSSVSHSGSFKLETDSGVFQCSSLVIATGGLSIRPLGATDFGYRMANQFGLRIEQTKPGLVPLVLDDSLRTRLAKLSGISVDAVVTCTGTNFRENLLVTHRGLSGPAILQISSYWKPGNTVSINLLPDDDAFSLLKSNHNSETELANVLSRYLPRRFAHAWCELNAPSQPMKRYTEPDLERIAANLHALNLVPTGTEGYKKAEVTAGGVSTAELSSQTMEAKRVHGLYFIGEVVDVTGHLGGYNFQWAWSSAFAAGQHA